MILSALKREISQYFNNTFQAVNESVLTSLQDVFSSVNQKDALITNYDEIESVYNKLALLSGVGTKDGVGFLKRNVIRRRMVFDIFHSCISRTFLWTANVLRETGLVKVLTEASVNLNKNNMRRWFMWRYGKFIDIANDSPYISLRNLIPFFILWISCLLVVLVCFGFECRQAVWAWLQLLFVKTMRKLKSFLQSRLVLTCKLMVIPSNGGIIRNGGNCKDIFR